MFLTEAGIRQIPREHWPESFMFWDKNMQWPNESISCVIQKPDKGLCMLIVYYDHGFDDISVGYINEREGFSILCKAYARKDGPFFMETNSKLEELRRNAEWRRIVQRMNEVSATRERKGYPDHAPA
jgi:hypothetical protein